MEDDNEEPTPLQGPSRDRSNKDKKQEKKREKRKNRVIPLSELYPPIKKRPKHPEDFTGLDLRIGKLLDTRDNIFHRKGYSYMHIVDIGADVTRLIVSDLNLHGYTVDDLRDRFVVVVSNVKFTKKHGVETEGWILAANTGRRLELVKPPRECDDGDQVLVEGYPAVGGLSERPRLRTSACRRVFSEVRVAADRRVTYRGRPLHVEGGFPLTTDALAGCPVTDATLPRDPATWVRKESPFLRCDSDY